MVSVTKEGRLYHDLTPDELTDFLKDAQLPFGRKDEEEGDRGGDREAKENKKGGAS